MGGKEGRSAGCVVMSVKVSAMFCGSVVLPIMSQLNYRISSLLIVRESRPLCWAVSCGRKVSLLELVKGYFDPNVQQSLSQSAS